MKWISCCSAVIMMLSMSAPANADVFDTLFGGGKSCGCDSSCQPSSCQPTCGAACESGTCEISECGKPSCCPAEPQCCQPVEPLVLSTCYTPPRLVCLCPPYKCCPPEVCIDNCCAAPRVVLPPPPSFPPEAPPECHHCECESECHCGSGCHAGSACHGGCGAVPSMAPEATDPQEEEMVPEPAGHAHTLYPTPVYQRAAPKRGVANALRIFK
jgi:hypothetical protein